MKSILILLNTYFWRGWIGPVFAYIVPLILALFIGRIIGATMIVPGVFMIPILSILLIFMPQSIFEFRNSSLLKRIGTTPIKPWKFLVGISIFNVVVVITAFLFLFVFCFAIFNDSLNDTFETIEIGALSYKQPDFLYMIKHADWGGYIYSSIIVIIISVLFGLLISSIAKSTLFIQSLGITIMLVSFFVGPCILPIALVGTVDVVKYIGYIIPLKYPISTAIESFTSGLAGSSVNFDSSSMWDINTDYKVFNIMGDFINITDPSASFPTIFDKTDKALNLAMPYLFIFILTYFVMTTFRWNNRGKLVFKWKIITETYRAIRDKQKHINLANEFKKQQNINSKYILEVKHLNKTFNANSKKEVKANNDINFNITRGRNLGILGSNGAGKSVLTEILVGVNQPDSGIIKYNYDYKNSFNESIGIQFQDSSYPYGIIVKDLIKFFIQAYQLKMTSKELNDLIIKFGIKDFYNKNAYSLSGGQQQRINLLLAILHKPKLIFLDELSTGLDIKIKSEIKEFIKDYANKNHMTIVVISHDMNEIEYLCDDIMVMKQGEVQDFRSKKDILKEYSNLESYVYKYL